MRVVLVGIVARGIVVVQVEAHADALAGIDGKLGVNVVFTVLLVATCLVGDVGVWRQGVDEQEVVRLLGREAVGLGEVELAGLRPVYEDTVDA